MEKYNVPMRTLTTLAALCVAFSAHAAPTPEAALQQFLQFELDGGRLQAWPYQRYLAVPAGYEEPGWDTVHVVQGYQAGAPRCAAARCTLTVTFAYAPTASLGAEQVVAHPEGGSEQVEYVAVQQDGQWLLASSNGTPRVSLAVLKKMLSDGL